MASADPTVREASASSAGARSRSLWHSFVDELESDPAAADQSQTVAGAIYAYHDLYPRVRARPGALRPGRSCLEAGGPESVKSAGRRSGFHNPSGAGPRAT